MNQKEEVARLFFGVDKKLKHSLRKSFESMGITMPQGIVMGELSKRGEMKISDLSNTVGLSNSTISGILDRLERQAMVVRTRSQLDKRIVYVKLSAEYENLDQSFHATATRIIGEILEKISEEEMEQVVKGLNVMKKALEGMECECIEEDDIHA